MAAKKSEQTKSAKDKSIIVRLGLFFDLLPTVFGLTALTYYLTYQLTKAGSIPTLIGMAMLASSIVAIWQNRYLHTKSPLRWLNWFWLILAIVYLLYFLAIYALGQMMMQNVRIGY